MDLDHPCELMFKPVHDPVPVRSDPRGLFYCYDSGNVFRAYVVKLDRVPLQNVTDW